MIKMKIETLTKIIAVLLIIIGICINALLLLLAFNIEYLTPQDLELLSEVTNLIMLQFQIFIPIYILVACVGISVAFLPKAKDDPIIRAVKTCGIMGGLLITLVVFLLMH